MEEGKEKVSGCNRSSGKQPLAAIKRNLRKGDQALKAKGMAGRQVYFLTIIGNLHLSRKGGSP